MRVTDAETIPDTEFRARIRDGEIRVTAEVEDFKEGTDDKLFSFAYDLVRTLAEVATISDGVSYIIVIDHVTKPDGEERRLVLADRRLSSIFSIFTAFTIEQIFDLVVKDQLIARTLSDVVVMLSWPNYTPIAAGRVIDSILRMMTGGKSAAHWEKLRENLRVDHAFLGLITAEATPARHGDRRYVSGPVNRELAERSWLLMNRYLAYRLGGNKPLDPLEFPILTG